MYFDTSVVLSLYVEDAFTGKAERFYEHYADRAAVSVWVDLEVKSALAFLVRTDRLALSKAQTALQTYDENRRRGVYETVPLSPAHFAAGAEALRLGGSLPAGDALHLGAAKVAGLPLVTSDRVLRHAAEAEGVVSTYLPDFRG